MAAGPGLRNYGSNLTQTDKNIRESRKVVKKVDNKIDQIKMAIDAVDKIEEKLDSAKEKLEKFDNHDKDRWFSHLRMPYEHVFSKRNPRVRYRGVNRNQRSIYGCHQFQSQAYHGA